MPDLFANTDPHTLPTRPVNFAAVGGDTAAELTPEHLASLGTQRHRVALCLADGSWWTLAELTAKCGGSQAGISARLRDLRKAEYGAFDVERDYMAAHSVYRYRVAAGDVSRLMRYAVGGGA